MMTLSQRIRRHVGGVALTEFAFTLPIALSFGLYGLELSNYALAQLRLSQLSLTLADNASRVGVDTALAKQDLREVDVNDVLQGLRIQGGGLKVTTNGRATISSLERNGFGGQYIHWQRCVGLKSGTGYDSSYGKTDDGSALLDGFTGMGNPKVQAPPNSAVMFVEINYDYQPLVSSFFLGAKKMKATASLIVRDNRNLDAMVTNPVPSVADKDKMTCDKHTI